MAIDGELRKRLNLVLSAKAFVLREIGDQGGANVLSPPSVPDADGIYWVSGETSLRAGQTIPSVFRVDTNAGGELLTVYWSIDGAWCDHHDEAAYAELGLERSDCFPFDWTYNVRLERDVFHV